MRERQWYGHDSGLTFRMFIVMFLLAALYLGFVAALFASGVNPLWIVIIAGGLLFAQYWFSDKIVLLSMGAHEVNERQAPELHDMVERLCAVMGLPKPRIAIADNDVPNAFATGRGPKSAVVCFTTGLLDRLTRSELEAVVAHELSHVRNRDVLVITLASFFATVAQFIMRFAMFGAIGDRRDRSGGSMAIVYVASILVWIISFFLIRALSRYRELAADRGAAIVTGAPSTLASALMRISGTMARIPQRDLRQVEGLNAFFIIPAISGSSFSELFSTHPSLERRLEQLRQLQQQMEGV
jgi:heat shock protein HtpX